MGRLRILWALLLLLALTPVTVEAGIQGGLVLMFDDGYNNWVTTIAPELAAVKGVATAYVSLNSIRSEKLTFADLRTLQDRYGWEIGTHTNHHFRPQEFVQRKGLSAWISQELDSPIRELKSHGLEVRNLSFPFDSTTPEICAAVAQRLESFRRPEPLALASGRRADGSIPGTEISLGNYVPLALLKKWIDLAHNQDNLLFLYGHQVLPEADFATGVVESVSQHTLTAVQAVPSLKEPDLYLLPDTSRRFLGVPIRVVAVSGRQIQAGRGDLNKSALSPRKTRPSPAFPRAAELLGPA
jgi:peptidoglycan/xylan/chitin deacetylase (PgdA/CDA1 family)